VKSRTTEYSEMTNNDAEMILQDMEPEKNTTFPVSFIKRMVILTYTVSEKESIDSLPIGWIVGAIRYYTGTTTRYRIENDQPSSFKRKRLYKGLEASTLKPISSNSFNCKL
jgi:hypothetical protein